MTHASIRRACHCARIAVWLCFFVLPAVALQDDYLTDKEIDQLRTEEGKEPPLRIKLLADFLKIRFERAKAVRTGVPYVEDEARDKSSKNKTASSKKGGGSGNAAEEATTAALRKPFKDLLEDYLKCLDEISTNVEDFSTLKTSEPKPYLKSLGKLSQALEEQQKWILESQEKAGRSEGEVFSDVVDALRDLIGDVKDNMEELELQIQQMKDAEKAKSSGRK